MRRIAIENPAHFHNGACELDFFTKVLCAIRRRKDGSADVQTDFASVDVKSCNQFDIARAVRTDLPVHQPDAPTFGGGSVTNMYLLDKRAGAASNPNGRASY